MKLKRVIISCLIFFQVAEMVACLNPTNGHALIGKKSGGGIAIASGSVVGISTIALLVSAHFGASGTAVFATIGTLVGAGTLGIATGVVLLDESTNTLSLSHEAIHQMADVLELSNDDLDLFDQDYDLINAAFQTVGLTIARSESDKLEDMQSQASEIFASLPSEDQYLIRKIFK